ncbi:MAG: gas vesicle protein K [Actinoallomurus sp.]
MTEPFDARPYDPDAVLPPGTPARRGGRRIEADSETVQRDLAQLVLTVVELVRQLVERQCIRRVDQGDLSDEQVEEIGVTLMRLEEAMEELCERFGLSMSDLNLDLGPLGTLLPTDQD